MYAYFLTVLVDFFSELPWKIVENLRLVSLTWHYEIFQNKISFNLTWWCEFEQTPGVCDGQGGLACCSPWGGKESDMTEWLNWTEMAGRSERRQILHTLVKDTAQSQIDLGLNLHSAT